jgi:hypothetical protein
MIGRNYPRISALLSRLSYDADEIADILARPKARRIALEVALQFRHNPTQRIRMAFASLKSQGIKAQRRPRYT